MRPSRDVNENENEDQNTDNYEESSFHNRISEIHRDNTTDNHGDNVSRSE